MAEDLIVFNNDLVPAGRQKLTPYHLQIGDCALRVPPVSPISIRHVNNLNMLRGLRQRNPVMTQSGYQQTEIRTQLFFNGLEQINGVAIPAPDGGTYYVDGLRPLIAQFRRAPILPIFNETLNETHGIYTNILSNLTVETIPDFPNTLSANLITYKTTIEPYMLIPDEAFADYICWPVFRWYYQGLMNGRSAEYLAPVKTNNFTGRFSFSVMDEEALITANKEGEMPGDSSVGVGVAYIREGFEVVKINGEDRAIMPARKLGEILNLPVDYRNDPYNVTIGGQKFKPYVVRNVTPWVQVRVVCEALGYRVIWNNGTIILERLSAAGASFGRLDDNMLPFELPDTLKLTHLAVAIGNSFVNAHVQFHSTPCHQYLGSMEKQIIATFETKDSEAVEALRALHELCNYYSINYRNRIVSGFVRFHNELTELFGIRNVMIQDLQFTTVPDHPGLYRVGMSMIEFDRMQRAYERAAAISYLEALPSLQDAVASTHLYDMSEIEMACLLEEILEGISLYPDLDLPLHSELESAISFINSQRATYGLKAINLVQPDSATTNTFVDPDFYIDYSHLTSTGS